MTRLDEQTSPDPWLREKSEKEKLKEEIRDGVLKEMQRKKRGKILTCCILVLLLTIFFSSLIAAAIAKTGLVDVPIFSKILSKTPAPRRIVTVTPGETENFETAVTQKLKSQVEPRIKPNGTGQKIPVRLEFTEKELTLFLKDIEAQQEEPFMKNAQITVAEDAIEIFGEMQQPKKIFLTLGLRPELKNGDLTVALTKIKLGTLSLPVSLSNFWVNKFLNDKLKTVGETISKVGKIENISLEDGKIVLQGLVDILVFTKNQGN